MSFSLGFWAAAGAGGGASAGDYELISSTILTSNQTSVTFSSFASTYKYLQIRYTAQVFESSANYNLRMYVNGDTGSNWAKHYLFGDGSNRYSDGQAGVVFNMRQMIIPDNYGGNANIFAAGIFDIVDYANSSKNTVVRVLGGNPYAGTYKGVALHSGVWLNTSPVTSITLQTDDATGYPLKTGSRFSLYGVKG
jgi:hypothetical protein